MPIGSRTPSQVPGTETPQTVSVTVTANYTEQQYQKVFTCRSTELSTIAPTHTVTQQAAVLSVSPSTRNVAASGGNSGTFTVTSTWGWTATSSQSWATVVISGNTFYVRCLENTVTSTRTATISVSNGYIMKGVTVTQEAAVENYLTISPTGPLNTDYSSGQVTLTVSSNVSWSTLGAPGINIISGSSGSGNGTVVFTYDANTSTTATLSRIVTVSGAGISRNYQINQSPWAVYLTINPTSATGAQAGGTGSFSVQSNGSWTATGSTNIVVTGGSSGSGNGTVSYSYSANPTTSTRYPTITVSTTGITRTFTLNQSGNDPVLTITPNNSTFSGAGEQKNATLISTSAWTSSSDSTWLSTSPSGVGNAPLIITAARNTGAARNGRITFTNTEGLTATYIASQARGGSLTVTPSSIQVNGGSDFTIIIESTSAWTIRLSGAIDGVSQSSGNAPGGTVTVYPAGAIEVYQYGTVFVTNTEGVSASCSVTITDMNA